MQQQNTTANKPWRLTPKRLAIAVSLMVLLGIGAWQGYAAYTNRQLASNIPARTRESIDFPIYLPNSPNVQIKKDSFSYTSGVLQFECVVDGTDITVAEQEKASGFELNNFTRSDNMASAKTFNTANGDVLVGKVGLRTIAIMETELTIVTLTSLQSTPTSALELTVRSLRQL